LDVFDESDLIFSLGPSFHIQDDFPLLFGSTSATSYSTPLTWSVGGKAEAEEAEVMDVETFSERPIREDERPTGRVTSD